MSEQAPSPDTPELDAAAAAANVTSDSPDAGTATDQTAVDWEKRAKDNQAWATRLAQQNSEFEQRLAALDDPDQFRNLLAERGYQVEDPETGDSLLADDSSAQEIADLRKQLSEIAEWKQGLTSEQQQQQAYSAYREDVDPQLKQMNVPEAFIEQTADIAFNHLPPIQTPAGPKPDLEGAVKQVAELAQLFAQHPDARNSVLEEYRASKRAPHIGQAGTAGTTALPLDADHAQRAAFMNERLQADA